MQYHGEVAALNDLQRKCLEEVLQQNQFSEDTDITVETVGEPGDNYMSNVTRISAEDRDGKIMKLFAKIAPTEEMKRQMTFPQIIFNNEITMYQELLPKLAQLEEKANIPPEKRFRRAKLFAAIRDAPSELILLEDLREAGYSITDRLLSFTDEQMKMSLQQLATYHSLCLVLKREQPEFFEELKGKFINLWLQHEKAPFMKNFFQQFDAVACSFLEDEGLRSKVRGAMGDALDNVVRLSEVEAAHDLYILGDCWTNNIMFNSQDGADSGCVHIDYQQTRLTSPISDVTSCIFNCSQRDIRRRHHSAWLRYYRAVFTDVLAYFQIDVQQVYPQASFDHDLKKYGRLNLGLCLLLSLVQVKAGGEVMQPSDVTALSCEAGAGSWLQDAVRLQLGEDTVMRLKKRTVDISQDFVLYGYV